MAVLSPAYSSNILNIGIRIVIALQAIIMIGHRLAFGFDSLNEPTKISIPMARKAVNPIAGIITEDKLFILIMVAAGLEKAIRKNSEASKIKVNEVSIIRIEPIKHRINGSLL